MTFYLIDTFSIDMLDPSAWLHQVNFKQITTSQAARIAPSCQTAISDEETANHFSRLLEQPVSADDETWAYLQLAPDDVALVGQAGWWLVTLSPYGRLLSLAALLPTGLKDHNAGMKYAAEWKVLQAALASGDQVGAILEAADCAYYVAKAWANGYLTEGERAGRLRDIARALYDKELNYSPDDILRAAVLKYDLRAAPAGRLSRLVRSRRINCRPGRRSVPSVF